MNSFDPRAIVTVTIGDEEYRIRASASPEYTRRCAEYVDRKLSEIRAQGAFLEEPRAAILVAMALADELFGAREEVAALSRSLSEAAGRLAADVESSLAD